MYNLKLTSTCQLTNLRESVKKYEKKWRKGRNGRRKKGSEREGNVQNMISSHIYFWPKTKSDFHFNKPRLVAIWVCWRNESHLISRRMANGNWQLAKGNWQLTTDSGLGATGSMAFNSIPNSRYDKAVSVESGVSEGDCGLGVMTLIIRSFTWSPEQQLLLFEYAVNAPT